LKNTFAGALRSAANPAGTTSWIDNMHPQHAVQTTDWLRNLLADGGKAATDVRQAAQDAGIAWSAVRKAQIALSIKPARQSQGAQGAGRWVWQLPQGAQGQVAPAQDAQSPSPPPAQDTQTEGLQGAQAQDAQSEASQGDQTPPRRKREIRIRRRGVAAENENEMTWEEYEAIECDRTRVASYIRQRDSLRKATADAEA
jgi:hypothetical protein